MIDYQVFKLGNAQPEVPLELVGVQAQLLQERVQLTEVMLPRQGRDTQNRR